jgi:dGTPase
LNDVSMQKFRVAAIAKMVPAATETFVKSVSQLLEGSVDAAFELIPRSTCGVLCATVKEFDKRFGFRHRDVLKLELQGNCLIKSFMEMVWPAIQKSKEERSPFERYVFNEISEGYRRVYSTSEKDTYAKYQLLCDAVSGMTESHLIKKHSEFQSLRHAPISP